MNRVVACLSILLVALLPAGGQNLSPELRQAVQSYQLDIAKANRLTSAMAELSAYTVKQPNWQQSLAARMKMPMEQQIKAMAADPGTMGILKKANLDAREYTVGLFALRGAVLAAKGLNTGMGALASPANIAFVKANPAAASKFEQAEMGQR